MVALISPLNDMEMTPEVATYVAILERQVTAFQIQEFRFRALLEMLTGESWDDLSTDLEAGELRKIAADAAQKKLGVSYAEAQKIVRQRQAEANAEFEAKTAGFSNESATVSRPTARGQEQLPSRVE